MADSEVVDQEYSGWIIRIFRMAIGNKYPKPYCATAKRRIGPKKLEFFNIEGKTAEEAGWLVKEQIVNKDMLCKSNT